MNVEVSGDSSPCSICIGEEIGLDPYPKDAPHDPDICLRNKGPELSRPRDDDENQLLFCPPRIWAFSLRYKTWKFILPRDLKPIEPSTEPSEHLRTRSKDFDSLEDLLTDFRDFRERPDESRSLDTIPSKGRGVNFLIQGESGTGKTLTVGKPSEHI